MPLFEPSIVSISAGTTWATGPGISFGNGGGITFGFSGNTLTATVVAGAAAGIGAASAGTQLATSGTISFRNANGVSFGMFGSSIITASVAGGGLPNAPVTIFSQGNFDTNYLVSAGKISFQHVSLPMHLSGSNGLILLNVSGNSANPGGYTISFGAYSLTGRTAGLILSTVGTLTWNAGSDTSDPTQYGGISGTRYRSFPFASSLTPGDYLFALALSADATNSLHLFGRYGANIVGSLAFETAYFIDGVSLLTTSAFPLAILATDANYLRTGQAALQQPGFILLGTT